MKHKILSYIIFIFLYLFICKAGFSLTAFEKNNITVFKHAKNAVVSVTTNTEQLNFFSFQVSQQEQGSGTGIIWDKSGLIITNYHVIESADKITVTLRNQFQYTAQVIGSSPSKDLAVLKIKAPQEILTPLPLGNSSLLQVGNKVLAIGNPFGLSTSLSVGIVSALNRELTTENKRTIRNIIQTDAAINPGNSGGPLLNAKGELIGMTSQIYSTSGSNSGIGFAIPVNTIASIIPQLVKYGRLRHPQTGLSFVRNAVARQLHIHGIIIMAIKPNSPASKAGLLGLQETANNTVTIRDVITAVDNKKVTTIDAFLNILETHKPQDTLKLSINRLNTKQHLTINLVLGSFE